eukprot:TRINITY_DN12033_c0_g1::TRINITY_DN12033_c0_g1_i1::g.9738::m.9738 TRINITY_DN12033_c0_g1::TRINITY_DN12033_c0_g1_i1::g.9738  ORF type:complete len:277 (+),score=45.36,BAR/PF03114.13/8.1e-12,Arfaptin/PF06456.8/2.4e-10,BAR_2/PF10455.4/1.4e-05,Cep57_CLD/PF14073.1/1.3,Cep57_CLD/PF14073.1/0.06,Tropomyosin_1/PF12718.2/2.7e+02,Tropomyosin_1/PF12718.2/1.2e+03,Tropomyosin_1/PF12718.2/0.023,Ndr/PF03096.9/0.11,DUF3595/PF12166.3/0.17,AHS1/PF02682.11/1.1e+02,AHS1/PF02682.11/0.62,PolyA_pol/PF01743.15/2.1e+03,Poly
MAEVATNMLRKMSNSLSTASWTLQETKQFVLQKMGKAEQTQDSIELQMSYQRFLVSQSQLEELTKYLKKTIANSHAQAKDGHKFGAFFLSSGKSEVDSLAETYSTIGRALLSVEMKREAYAQKLREAVQQITDFLEKQMHPITALRTRQDRLRLEYDTARMKTKDLKESASPPEDQLAAAQQKEDSAKADFDQASQELLQTLEAVHARKKELVLRELKMFCESHERFFGECHEKDVAPLLSLFDDQSLLTN